MPKVINKFYYRDILKRAFDLVKHNKYLWFFGFFAAAMGGLGEFESVFKDYNSISETSDGIFTWQSLYQGGFFWIIVENIKTFFSDFPWQAFFILLITAVVFIVIYWLAIVSQIALFDAAHKLSRNKKTKYAEGYSVGNKHFFPVLAVNIGFRIILYGIFIIIAAPLLSWFLVGENVWGGIFFVILLFLIYIPISVIVSFIIKYTIAYIVIHEKKTWESVKSAWHLFKRNWLVSIEMALIILLLGILIGLVIILALGLAAVPFALIAIAAMFFGSTTGLAVAIILGTLTWFVIIAIFGSGYVAFQYSAWTLLFLDLVGDRAESKLKRLIGRFIG
ncbi:MAG: hypothetical protein Q8P20_06320 [bacterium]|nr:hypothetical protein [bacterium]